MNALALLPELVTPARRLRSACRARAQKVSRAARRRWSSLYLRRPMKNQRTSVICAGRWCRRGCSLTGSARRARGRSRSTSHREKQGGILSEEVQTKPGYCRGRSRGRGSRPAGASRSRPTRPKARRCAACQKSGAGAPAGGATAERQAPLGDGVSTSAVQRLRGLHVKSRTTPRTTFPESSGPLNRSRRAARWRGSASTASRTSSASSTNGAMRFLPACASTAATRRRDDGVPVYLRASTVQVPTALSARGTAPALRRTGALVQLVRLLRRGRRRSPSRTAFNWQLSGRDRALEGRRRRVHDVRQHSGRTKGNALA